MTTLVVKNPASTVSGGNGYAFLGSSTIATGAHRCEVTQRLSGSVCGDADEAPSLLTATMFIFTSTSAVPSTAADIAVWLGTDVDLTATPTAQSGYTFVRRHNIPLVVSKSQLEQADVGDTIQQHVTFDSGVVVKSEDALTKNVFAPTSRLKVWAVWMVSDALTATSWIRGTAEVKAYAVGG